MALPTNPLAPNPRKQKLTEARGTNPTKLGAVASPSTPTPARPPAYAQDTAPHKGLSVEYPFAVGGPGFPGPAK